jgi:hypothetical protein
MATTGPNLAGELCVRAGGERGHLLVAHLHELQLAGSLCDGLHDPVDPVAGVPEDATDAPLQKPADEELACCLCHRQLRRGVRAGTLDIASAQCRPACSFVAWTRGRPKGRRAER